MGKQSKRVTLKDIAAEAGVSQMVVSHVLTGAGAGRIRVSAEKRKLVEETAKRMNYVPNLAARQLSTGRSKTIGLMIDHVGLGSAPWRLLPVYLNDQLQKFGFQVISSYTHFSHEKQAQALNFFQAQNVEAVVHLNLDRPVDWRPTAEVTYPFPYLFIGNCEATTGPRLSIGFAEGSELVTRHFLDLGYKRIAFLRDNNNWLSHVERLAGYEKALTAANLPIDPALIITDHRVNDAFSAYTSELLTQLFDLGVEAIVAQSDYCAMAFQEAMRQINRFVPVIGQDNNPFTDYCYPRLSSLDYQIPDFGHKIAEVVTEQIAHPATTHTHWEPILAIK